jgi:hypothetical protein
MTPCCSAPPKYRCPQHFALASRIRYMLGTSGGADEQRGTVADHPKETKRQGLQDGESDRETGLRRFWKLGYQQS